MQSESYVTTMIEGYRRTSIQFKKLEICRKCFKFLFNHKK